jgi:hypothetical protein
LQVLIPHVSFLRPWFSCSFSVHPILTKSEAPSVFQNCVFSLFSHRSLCSREDIHLEGYRAVRQVLNLQTLQGGQGSLLYDCTMSKTSSWVHQTLLNQTQQKRIHVHSTRYI